MSIKLSSTKSLLVSVNSNYVATCFYHKFRHLRAKISHKEWKLPLQFHFMVI